MLHEYIYNNNTHTGYMFLKDIRDDLDVVCVDTEDPTDDKSLREFVLDLQTVDRRLSREKSEV